MAISRLTTEDRIDIDDLLTRYASAIDGRDWELLDTVFVHDAHLDYRSAGGVSGDYPEVRRWLTEVLPVFDAMQHHVLNRVVRQNESEVRATSNFFNVNVLEIAKAPWIFKVGGRYHDRLVVDGGAWRIAERIEETIWWENPMPGLPVAPVPVPGLLDSLPRC
jgi:3-phenylpropionate/cinnamic acid dioxygenase small subunit